LNILNVKLSPRAENIITNIISKSDRFIEFEEINPAMSAFGGMLKTREKFVISSKKDLPLKAFEANIIHELVHTTQIVRKYPEVSNKETNSYNYFSTQFQSTILDLEVNDFLLKNDFDFSFFNKGRHKALKCIANRNFEDINTPILESEFTCMLCFMILVHQKKDSDFILSIVKPKFPDLINIAIDMSELIKSIGYDSPEKVFICFAESLTLLNHWHDYYIVFDNSKIDSYEKYLSNYSELRLSLLNS
jgi:hypothetical protein